MLKPDQHPTEAVRQELLDTVVRVMGKAFKPDKVRFVTELPKTRSAKIVRRVVRAAALDTDPGDLSSLENPQALEAVKRAV